MGDEMYSGRTIDRVIYDQGRRSASEVLSYLANPLNHMDSQLSSCSAYTPFKKGEEKKMSVRVSISNGKSYYSKFQGDHLVNAECPSNQAIYDAIERVGELILQAADVDISEDLLGLGEDE